jgi:arylformamidase
LINSGLIFNGDYIGKCQVIIIRFAQDEPLVIQLKHLPQITASRILFATDTFDYYQPFNHSFATLSDEVCDFLINAGCCLIGVDTPSLDTVESQENHNHLKILAHKIAVIEGLNLRDTLAGEYEMLAIPLALVGLEASPLRVLIRSINI